MKTARRIWYNMQNDNVYTFIVYMASFSSAVNRGDALHIGDNVTWWYYWALTALIRSKRELAAAIR